MECPDLADEDVFGGTCVVPSVMYRSRSGPVKISRTGASPYRAMSWKEKVNEQSSSSITTKLKLTGKMRRRTLETEAPKGFVRGP